MRHPTDRQRLPADDCPGLHRPAELTYSIKGQGTLAQEVGAPEMVHQLDEIFRIGVRIVMGCASLISLFQVFFNGKLDLRRYPFGLLWASLITKLPE